MNLIYRVVRHAVTGQWVVASEWSKGRKKTTMKALASAMAMSMTWTAMATDVDAQQSACPAGYALSADATGQPMCMVATTPEVSGYAVIAPRGSGDSALNVNLGGYGNPRAVSVGDIALGEAAIAQSAIAGDHAATALGFAANAIGQRTLAVAMNARATADDAIALGYSANATATGAIALGRAAKAESTNSVALGIGADVSSAATNSVALGAGSVADQANTVSVGTASVGGQRRVVNVAAGTQAYDAVNISQLKVLVDGLGGDASIDPGTGAVTGPRYTLANGGTQTTVGGALGALDNALTSTNVSVTQNTADINTINQQLADGQVGLVRQDAATGTIDVATGLGGSLVNIAGSDGGRVLTGLANGINDNDAVTLAQLKATGLIDYTGKELGALVYDDLTLGTATLGGVNGTVLGNLANGYVGAGSMQAVNGGQLYDLQSLLQGQIDSLDGRVSGIEQGIADGSIGSGSGSGGAGNDAGGNPIHNVGAGVADSDAVNVGQMNEQVQEAIATANAYTDGRVDALSQTLDTFKGEVDQRFRQQDVKISRVGAMSTAMSQMAFSAQGINTPNRVGVGIGTQGGKNAIAVGYSRQIKPNVNLSFGGSASGSETSAGAGLGLGW